MHKTGIGIIQLKDVNAVHEIASLCFGDQYLPISQINKYLRAPGVFIHFYDHNQILGYCIGLVQEHPMNNDFYEQFPIQPQSYPAGLIKSIAVLPGAQNKGIGTRLLEACLHKMKFSFECRSIYYPAWTESENFAFTRKLKNHGFSSSKVIENYWSAESVEKNYQCKRCGNPPCSCSMTLFSNNVS